MAKKYHLLFHHFLIYSTSAVKQINFLEDDVNDKVMGKDYKK